MGADIYSLSVVEADQLRRISSVAYDELTEAQKEEADEFYKALFSGERCDNDLLYFRDSYNGTNLFWRLGLSWWESLKPYLDETEYLISGDNLVRFRNFIREHMVQPATREVLEHYMCRVEDEGDNSLESWNKFFVEKYDNFMKFLDYAIENNRTLYCSV
jgi:hypothetical protein